MDEHRKFEKIKAGWPQMDNLPHQCEAWQMMDSAKGGKYCGACGKHDGEHPTITLTLTREEAAVIENALGEWAEEYATTEQAATAHQIRGRLQ
jgi:hypothetical protein